MSDFELQYTELGGMRSRVQGAGGSLADCAARLRRQVSELSGQSGFGIESVRSNVGSSASAVAALSTNFYTIAAFLSDLEKSVAENENKAYAALAGGISELVRRLPSIGDLIPWLKLLPGWWWGIISPIVGGLIPGIVAPPDWAGVIITNPVVPQPKPTPIPREGPETTELGELLKETNPAPEQPGSGNTGGTEQKPDVHNKSGISPESTVIWTKNGSNWSVYTNNKGGEKSCTYYTLEKLREKGLDFLFDDSGGVGPGFANGGNWYDHSAGGPKFGGSNAIYDIINQYGEPVENIVISFQGGGSGDTGHVLLIDKIENGVVYFSDNLMNKYHLQPQAVPLAEFHSRYGNFATMVGAVYVGT
jgi:hypothetical protein